jgi:uncharacterized protein (TIGR03067 family)
MPATASGVTLIGVRPGTDLDLLQGSWATVAGPKEARLLVAGDRFAFEFANGDIYIGTFTLDPHADPKRMDMRIEEGPVSHKGCLALCIYEFDGDLLRWCPAKPGDWRRLSCFPSVDDGRFLSLVFAPARPRKPR